MCEMASIQDSCFSQMEQAKMERDMALATYNECTPEWETVCWHEYQAAEERVRVLLREARRQGE